MIEAKTLRRGDDDLRGIVRAVSYDEFEAAIQFLRDHFQLYENKRETDPETGREVTVRVPTANWTPELMTIDRLLIAAQVWQANNTFRQLSLFDLEEVTT